MATINYVRRDPRTGQLVPANPPGAALPEPAAEDGLRRGVVSEDGWSGDVHLRNDWPPDYHGFVGLSYVQIQFRYDGEGQRGLLVFQGSEVSIPVLVPFEFVRDRLIFEPGPWPIDAEESASAGDGTEGGEGLGPLTTTVKIVDNPPDDEHYPTTDNLLWGAPVDTSRFDSVALTVISRRSVWVKQIKIVLNNMTIMNRRFERLIELRPGMRLALDNFIRAHRRNYIRFYDIAGLFGLPSFEYLSPLVPMLADDLGQAWDPRYCPWDDNDNHPVPWCSEYIAWLVTRATGGRHVINPRRGSMDLRDNSLPAYYTEYARYITPATHDYEALGHLIRPGDFVQVDRGGHTTMFICWIKGLWEYHTIGQTIVAERRQVSPPVTKDRPVDYTPIPFQPQMSINYFLGVGGNQVWAAHPEATFEDRLKKFRGLNVVGRGCFSVTNVPPDLRRQPDPVTWASIVWVNDTDYIGENAYRNYRGPGGTDEAGRHRTPYFDGFGDSRLLFTLGYS